MHFHLPCIFAVLHSLVHFLQIVTMQVAVNSHNNPLITLVVSNNFVELKGGLFKKNSRLVVFQIAAADVVERFQICIFVALIVLQQPSAGAEMSAEWISDASWISFMVIALEAVVDWVKTGFILTFNRISPAVFAAFERVLCQDLVQRSRSQVALDTSHCAARRLGFSALPLCAVCVRLLWQILWLAPHADAWKARVFVACAAAAFALKMTLGCALMACAARSASSRDVAEEEEELEASARISEEADGPEQEGAVPSTADRVESRLKRA